MTTESRGTRAAALRDGVIDLVHVVTVPETFIFLDGQTQFMRERGFRITGVSSAGPYQDVVRAREPIVLIALDMARRITPVRDVITVIRLHRILRRIRPAIVHAHTPKGGLLGTVAAWIARVPVRVYHMRGLPFVTSSGVRRQLLKLSERLSCTLAHRVLCVSHSVREIATRNRLCPADKIVTLLGGSGNGVDATGRFDPDSPPGDVERRRLELRGRLGIPSDALVIAFLGRVVREKGIVELNQAFADLKQRVPSAHLIVAGPLESQDPIPDDILRRLRDDPRVHLIGPVDDPRSVYAASDVVALPSYREGFPNVPLEAASMRKPVVATRVPGCTDAIVDQVTGLLVAPRDAVALAGALLEYLDDEELRRCHGSAGRERVLREFRRDAIWAAIAAEYRALLQAAGQPIPPGLREMTASTIRS